MPRTPNPVRVERIAQELDTVTPAGIVARMKELTPYTTLSEREVISYLTTLGYTSTNGIYTKED